jgi:hypothetical protein
MSTYINSKGNYLSNLNGIFDTDGSQIWTDSDGEEHREDGPAVIWEDGVGDWYQHGKLHREDGTAYNFSSKTTNEYWLYGQKYSKDEWIDYLKSGESTLKQSVISRLILENS